MAEKHENLAVIDASFILCYLLPDERIAQVESKINDFKQGTLKLISSQLLNFEISNGLYAAVLFKRINSQLATELLTQFLRLPIELENVNFEEALSLAVKRKISVYDASYAYLALSKDLHLLTLDKKLKTITK